MPDTFSLKNFDGPIELLFLLVQKDEMQIIDIAMHLLTQQLLINLKGAEELNEHSDQVAIIAHLLALKSRKIAPFQENKEELVSLDNETRMTIIEQLLEHCQFREIAEALQEKELQSHIHFTRMLPPPSSEKRLLEVHGLEEVTLNELKKLFESVYKEAKESPFTMIKGHKWEIRDKIELLITLLAQQKELLFAMLFEKTSSREELIVTFLAVLELIKQGKLLVVLEENELKFTRH